VQLNSLTTASAVIALNDATTCAVIGMSQLKGIGRLCSPRGSSRMAFIDLTNIQTAMIPEPILHAKFCPSKAANKIITKIAKSNVPTDPMSKCKLPLFSCNVSVPRGN
tara:strand:- start:195 stop:518 length:324 start_codon:yes stop_codon:yes gene_type:complete